MEKNTTSLIYRIFAALLSILLLVLSGFAAYQIVTLNVLPSNLLLPVILIIVILNAILILLMNFATHVIWTKAISVILVILVGCTMGFGNVYLYETYSTLTSVTGAEKGSIKNTISVITKTDHDEEIQSLKNEKIGVLRNIDSVGTKKCQKKLKKYSFSYKKQIGRAHV